MYGIHTIKFLHACQHLWIPDFPANFLYTFTSGLSWAINTNQFLACLLISLSLVRYNLLLMCRMFVVDPGYPLKINNSSIPWANPRLIPPSIILDHLLTCLLISLCPISLINNNTLITYLQMSWVWEKYLVDLGWKVQNTALDQDKWFWWWASNTISFSTACSKWTFTRACSSFKVSSTTC